MPSTITARDSAPGPGRLPAQYPAAPPAMAAGAEIDFEAEGLLDGLEGEQRARAPRAAARSSPPTACRSRNCAARPPPARSCSCAADRRDRRPASATPPREVAELQRHRARVPDRRRAARWACRSPSPTRPSTPTPSSSRRSMLTSPARRASPTRSMLDLLRVLGRGLSQAAESLRALPLKTGARARDQRGRAGPAATPSRGRAALPAASTRCSASLLALHLRHATQSDGRSARWSAAAGGCRARARSRSCFADLVGFTRLGEEVPPDELGAPRGAPGSARRRRRRAAGARWSRRSATPRCSPRPSPRPLLDAALALIEAADAEGEDFPQLRAGAALGPALPRAGDWFGRPVNLASRITSVARPGSLLAERALRDIARRGLPLVLRRRAPPARACASRVRLFRARRPGGWPERLSARARPAPSAGRRARVGPPVRAPSIARHGGAPRPTGR